MGIEIYLFVKEICRFEGRFWILSAATAIKMQTKHQKPTKMKTEQKVKNQIYFAVASLNFQATQSESASLQIVAKNQQRNLINELMI